MARKVARPDRRQKLQLDPPKVFLPNPPQVCSRYGLQHRMIRKFKPQTVDNPAYTGPPPPPIIVLSCDCGAEEPVDLAPAK